jgi:bacterioferritin-associated ferredoxin
MEVRPNFGFGVFAQTANDAMTFHKAYNTFRTQAAAKPVDPETDPANQVMVSSGHGSGCGHCVGMASGMVSKQKLAALKQQQYSKIMAHEQAHASAAGGFGGGIHIEYDSNGIAVAGHVPVRMPALDPSAPDKAISAGRQVRAAALAPIDPSGADLGVAAAASAIEAQGQVLLKQKTIQLASTDHHAQT